MGYHSIAQPVWGIRPFDKSQIGLTFPYRMDYVIAVRRDQDDVRRASPALFRVVAYRHQPPRQELFCDGQAGGDLEPPMAFLAQHRDPRIETLSDAKKLFGPFGNH